MNEQTILAICYIIVVIISALAGFLGREILYNRKSIKDLRDLNKKSGPTAEGGLETIAEIRERQKVEE